MREGRNRLLWETLCVGVLLSILLTVPLWSNGGKEKTAKEWLEEYYGEPFYEGPEKKPPERAPEGSLEAKLEIDHPPRLGETARITLTVASNWDFPRVRVGITVGRTRNLDKPPGIEIVSWPEGFEIEGIPRGDLSCMMSSQLKKGERRVFGFVIKVTSEGVKSIGGGIGELAPLERMVTAGDNIFLDVGEKETKTSRTPFPDPPEYWATPLIQGTGPMMDLDLMREGMEAFIKEAPGLTRWEARWLMDKVEHSVVIEGIPYEEQVRKSLKKALEEGRRLARKRKVSKLEAFKTMVEDWKKNRPTYRWIDPTGKEFDEKGRPREGLNMRLAPTDSVRVTGYWMYKKHRYNKDQGLLGQTDDKPLRKALLYFWEDLGSDSFYYYLGKMWTEEDGSFDKWVLVFSGLEWHNVRVVVHMAGPGYPVPYTYMIRVASDTVTQYPTSPDTRWWRFPSAPKEVHNDSTADFGTMYAAERVGLYPEKEQPRSGATNIYDALLRGANYVIDTLIVPKHPPVTAVWEPGYHPRGHDTSVYAQDTIKVCGRMVGYPDERNTDEWDDDVLVHEYSHFLMDSYAELEPGGATPDWSADWGKQHWRDAWEEAWAYVFSSTVRHDSFFVNTGHGIGKQRIFSYYNLENENDFWFYPEPSPDTMEGGAGCIDAIAASLWDFCDATNESWPDGRQDRLSLGFSLVWDVFDNYDPVLPAGNGHDNCWNIYEFWKGWLARGHNYPAEVKEVFNHHGIGGREVRGFSATGGDQKVDLEWQLEDFSEGGSKSADIFNIYRSDFEFGPYALIDSTDYVPGETLYVYSDTTVEYVMPYWYKVGAVDSVGLETESETDSGVPYNLPSPPVPPAPVTNLAAFDTPFDEGESITLTWTKSVDDSMVTNYYIYRSSFSGSRYDCIDSVGQGVERSIDNRAVDGDTLYYIVRAHNGTNGSSSEEVWAVCKPNRLGTSDTDLATAFNNARKVAADSANVHVVFQSEGQIWYSACDAQGGDWSAALSLGEGKTPSLDLDMQGDPHVVWIGPEEPQGTWLYYARYDGVWDVDSLLFVTSNTRPYLPSFQVDDSAYGHMVWEEHAWKAETPVLINYAVFNTQNPASISVENIDAMFGNGWFCSASVTLDSADVPHVVWRKEDQGRIYYSFRDTGTHTWTPPELISQGVAMRAEWPCLDFCGNRVSAVWMASTGIVPPDIFYRSRPIDSSWAPIEPVHLSMDSSGYPVIVAGSYVLWAEKPTMGPGSYHWEVFGKRRAPDGTWDAVMNLSNSPEVDSRFPQAAFWQDADTGYLYVAWAEGDSAPFAVMVRRLEVPRVPGWGERTTAGVDEGFPLIPLPRVFALSQNYPNPFGGATTIRYQLPKEVQAELKVYNICGQLVKTLADERQKPGYYVATWDGRDSRNGAVASGIYFYRLVAEDFTAARKLVVLR